MILYYSGTGNSRYIANRIAKSLKDPVISINDRIKQQNYQSIQADGRLILVVPTYAWRIPRIVSDWLQNTQFQNVRNVWFIMNCGDSIGTAPAYNARLCREKGWIYKGTSMIVMPENYIALFQVPKDSTAKKIIAKADPLIHDAAEAVQNSQSFSEVPKHFLDPILSTLINPLFFRFIVKADKFTADDKCTGCGKCTILCPLNNISLQKKKPVWGKNCTHCMACINACPTQAIEYGHKSKGKPHYYLNS